MEPSLEKGRCLWNMHVMTTLVATVESMLPRHKKDHGGNHTGCHKAGGDREWVKPTERVLSSYKVLFWPFSLTKSAIPTMSAPSLWSPWNCPPPSWHPYKAKVTSSSVSLSSSLNIKNTHNTHSHRWAFLFWKQQGRACQVPSSSSTQYFSEVNSWRNAAAFPWCFSRRVCAVTEIRQLSPDGTWWECK